MPQLILHPGLKRRLKPVLEKWDALARSTSPCDPVRARQLVDQTYQNLGLSPPHIQIAKSPLEALLLFSLGREESSIFEGPIEDPIEGRDGQEDGHWLPQWSLRRRLIAQVQKTRRKFLNTSASTWLSSAIWRSSVNRLRANQRQLIARALEQHVAKNGEETILRMLGEPLPERLQKPVARGLLQMAMNDGDRFEEADALRYDYLLHSLQLKFLEPLAPLIELCGMAEGWFCDDHRVILVDRPVERHFDSALRLHNPTGPAIRYQDDLKVHAINGVAVPEFVIEHPETITAEMIQKERNAELARIMLLKFGEERYAENFAPKGEPWKDSHGFSSQLLETRLGHRTLARVRVTNSTPEPNGTHKIYWLRVPPGMTCAQEALAEIHVNPFRKSWKAYAPTVET